GQRPDDVDDAGLVRLAVADRGPGYPRIFDSRHNRLPHELRVPDDVPAAAAEDGPAAGTEAAQNAELRHPRADPGVVVARDQVRPPACRAGDRRHGAAVY